MIQLNLNDEEAETLRELLQRHLAGLEIEIRHTDHTEFKNLLRHRREVLQRTVARLPEMTGITT